MRTRTRRTIQGRNPGRAVVGMAACIALAAVGLGAAAVAVAVRPPEDLPPLPSDLPSVLPWTSSPRGQILDRDGVPLATSIDTARPGVAPRLYPLGAAGFPVTGAAVPGAAPRGLERHLDAYLSGANGDDPADVVLTIDADLQRIAHEALNDQQGSAVLLDVRTGEVLAKASTPSWDPNVWEQRPDGTWHNTIDPARWEAAGYDLDARPMHDRAAGETFPPGSTFKIVVASALLEHELANIHLPYCTGRSRFTGLRCHPAFNPCPPLSWAVSESYNNYFATGGISLGPDLRAHAEAFGFNQSFDLLAGVPVATWPTAISPAFADRDAPRDAAWFTHNPHLVAQGSIGQNEVEATPMQMAVAAAVVANGGRSITPHLVREMRAPAGSTSTTIRIEGSPGQRVIEADHAEMIRGAMVEVLRGGTAAGVVPLEGKGRVPTAYATSGLAVTVAGKTGTAEVEGEEPHSWFVAFAPVDEPRFAVAVVVENGGAGAEAAAPIGVAVLAEAAVRAQ